MPTNLIDVTSVEAHGTYQGEAFVNVFHFYKRDNTAITSADLTALHGILDDAAADTDSLAHLYQRMDSGLLVNRLYSRTYSTTAPVEKESAVAIAGASAGTDVQPMLAAMVKWTTAFALPTARGRTYFTGLTATAWDAADTDVLASSWVTDFQTKVNAFVTAWDANATWGFVVLSRKLREANDSTPFALIKSGSVQTRIALQTRRSPGR